MVTETLPDEPLLAPIVSGRLRGTTLPHQPMVVFGDIPPQETTHLKPVIGRIHLDGDGMYGAVILLDMYLTICAMLLGSPRDCLVDDADSRKKEEKSGLSTRQWHVCYANRLTETIHLGAMDMLGISTPAAGMKL